ncbi:Uncharacterised protein [Bordetella pertussis]|nr:Uncharacterised protein [Bordetella pertussis]
MDSASPLPNSLVPSERGWSNPIQTVVVCCAV